MDDPTDAQLGEVAEGEEEETKAWSDVRTM